MIKFAFVAIFAALLAFVQPSDIYSQKKSKLRSAVSRDTAIIADAASELCASLPPGFSKPKTDSMLFNADNGFVMMRIATSENTNSACMVGFYDYFPDYFKEKSLTQALDSLQRQTLNNMNGKMARQYKMMISGKKFKRFGDSKRPFADASLESRTTYFTTNDNNKTKYWRFALILDVPRVYQIAATSENKAFLDSPEINKMFDSIQIIMPE